MNTTIEKQVESAVVESVKIRVGKQAFDSALLQQAIDRVQSQAGRLKSTDEAKAAAKSIRELDGSEVSYIPVSAVTALIKAKKLTPEAGRKIRALDMIQRGLSELMA